MLIIHDADSTEIAEDLLSNDTVVVLEAGETVPIVFKDMKLNQLLPTIRKIVADGGKILSVRRNQVEVFRRSGERVVTEVHDDVEIFVNDEWAANRDRELVALREVVKTLKEEPRIFVNLFAGDGLTSKRLDQILSLADNWGK